MSDSSYPSIPGQMSRTDGTADTGGNGAAVNLQPAADQMAQGMHNAVDRLAETAAPHIERVEGAMTDATAQVKHQARQLREKGDEWADGVRDTVRRNPLSAVAAAIAIGAVIARIAR